MITRGGFSSPGPLFYRVIRPRAHVCARTRHQAVCSDYCKEQSSKSEWCLAYRARPMPVHESVSDRPCQRRLRAAAVRARFVGSLPLAPKRAGRSDSAAAPASPPVFTERTAVHQAVLEDARAPALPRPHPGGQHKVRRGKRRGVTRSPLHAA